MNQTGAGIHRDSRKEARAVRAESLRCALEEQYLDLICIECGNDLACLGWHVCSECLEQLDP